jgi:RNA polymerase sigma-70 factor (ECF subfamily)
VNEEPTGLEAAREPVANEPAAAGGEGLVAAIRRRDPDALRQIVELYLPHVLRAARGSGLRREEAEEVAQETFTTFLEIASRFEGRSQVRTFLFGILYRKVSERRRALGKERRHDPIDEVMESRFHPDGRWSRPPAAADALLRAEEVRRALEDCLAASPENQRMAFHLREVEGLSTDEICKILDVTATNLGVMLYRLRNRTRECLEAKSVGIEP